MPKTNQPSLTTSRYATALTLVWLIAGFAWLNHYGTIPANQPTILAQSRVNPNTAPWHELTELSRIGPTLAWRIVQYRQTYNDQNPEQPVSPAFNSAQDLSVVRGIGPKTVERIKPLLRFDPR